MTAANSGMAVNYMRQMGHSQLFELRNIKTPQIIAMECYFRFAEMIYLRGPNLFPLMMPGGIGRGAP